MKPILKYAYIQREQRQHFYLFDLLPLAGSVVAAILLARIGIAPVDWFVFVLMWIVSCIGIEIGYHRYFSHRSFEAKPWVETCLMIFGGFAAQGPAIAWASNHRHHHRFSDQPEDSHSPIATERNFAAKLRAFMHAHLLWKYQYPYPNPALYTPDLTRNSRILRWSARYRWLVLAGLALAAALGGLLSWSWMGALRSLLLGGVIRLTLTQHATWCINSLCHLIGRRGFETTDQSRNLGILAFPTLGGSWHNNHHAFPTLAKTSHQWWELDPGYWIIRALEILGQTSKVKRRSPSCSAKRSPSRGQRTRARAISASSPPESTSLSAS